MSKIHERVIAHFFEIKLVSASIQHWLSIMMQKYTEKYYLIVFLRSTFSPFLCTKLEVVGSNSSRVILIRTTALVYFSNLVLSQTHILSLSF